MLAMSMPAPTAAPLSAAMYGLSSRATWRGTLWTLSRSQLRRPAAATGRSLRAVSATPESPFRSAPAQKARPAPVRMTARTSPSVRASSSASVHSRIIVGVKAFIRSGRFRVMVAMLSVLS